MGNRAARALLPELRFAAEEIRRQARHSESTYPGALHGRTADTIVPEQRDQSVILLNQSERAIALLQVLWQYTLADGRSYLDSIAWVGNKILLLLFHLSEGQKKVFEYWHSIFPDSKRYLAPGGVVVGDNTDVRLPTGDEIWHGGYVSGSGSPMQEPRYPVQSLTVSIDGAFFLDGEFVGKNHRMMFEEVSSAGAAHLSIARLAKEKTAEGYSPKAVLEAIEKLTRPVGERRPRPVVPSRNTLAEAFEKQALVYAGWDIASMRKFQNDDQVLRVIDGWGSIELPHFRKHA